MDRRRILLVVAVVVALLGTALVYLYVRGADARANEPLRDRRRCWCGRADRGRGVDRRRRRPTARSRSAGRPATTCSPATRPRSSPSAERSRRAASTPASRSSPTSSARRSAPGRRRSRSQGDDRPSRSASPTPPGSPGFVNPGSKVAIFFNGTGAGRSALHPAALDGSTVIGVGSTTTTQTTTTTAEGTETTEQLPRTLMTLALDRATPRRSSSARPPASSRSPCSPRTATSTRAPASPPPTSSSELTCQSSSTRQRHRQYPARDGAGGSARDRPARPTPGMAGEPA